MEHEPNKTGETLSPQIFLARAERFNELFSQNLDKLKKEEKTFAESLPKVIIEVEELKKIRGTLVASLEKVIRETIDRESRVLAEILSRSFLETTAQGVKTQQNAVQESLKMYKDELNALKSSFEDYLDEEKQSFTKFAEKYHEGMNKTFQQYSTEAAQFKREMEGVVSTLKKLLTLQKQRLTRKGLLICGVFCAASVLTGGLLFYLFPQHVYNPDKNIAKYIVIGKMAWQNFAKFSPKDQDLLLEEVKKYMMLTREKK